MDAKELVKNDQIKWRLLIEKIHKLGNIGKLEKKILKEAKMVD
jgi:hypothetical protein